MSAQPPPSTSTETITLGGGCFWCVEAVFLRVRGVTAVESGYCNGHTSRPTYEAVCGGDTGHAEVVRVSFDPAVITLAEILAIFFAVHDPTTPNRQGNDVGTQYRSAIYLEHADQAVTVSAAVKTAQQGFSAPIVTEVDTLANYTRAEDYHQRYFEQHPGQGYCAYVVAPKVDKFRRSFASYFKA